MKYTAWCTIRDDSQLAHAGHPVKDVKEKTTYKSAGILRNKRLMVISPDRYYT
jgi:hypothetical protein